MNLVYFFPSRATLTPGWRRKGLAATCPLTKEMFWRSWCCHENGDTPDWHTESLRPCWCKWCRGYSCASGSSTRPHLEDKTAECDWQEGRATSRTTSPFPGYHRHNHGVLPSECLLSEILFPPQFSLPRTRCHAYFSSVGEEVRSVKYGRRTPLQEWRRHPEPWSLSPMAAPWRADKDCCSIPWPCSQVAFTLILCLRGLARQPKKRSSQATEGLITDPSWGHQWKLCNPQRTHMQDRLLVWFICYTDDYFDYVSVSFISGCNCKKKEPSLSSCSPLRSWPPEHIWLRWTKIV